MKREGKRTDVEVLLPMQGATARAAVPFEIKRLIQQAVTEALAEKGHAIFEPWFRSRRVAFEIQRLQTVPEIHKWSAYFEKYGCLNCRKKRRSHGGNGFCYQCRPIISGRLERILEELANQHADRNPQVEVERTLSRAATAARLLGMGVEK